MSSRGLARFLEVLEKEDELLRVKKEVSPVHEISAVIRRAGGKAVLFEKVAGSDLRLAGNIFGDFRKIELALGAPRDKILREYLGRMGRLIAPKIVEAGPVKEKVMVGEEVDLNILPIPTINELDGGPFISAGIVVAKDPEFGPNLSILRLQLKGRNKTGIFMNTSSHLLTYLKRAEERGRGLEVAVVIGCDPLVYLASQVTGPIAQNEYEVAGALSGKPLELVKCETVDLEVPADAEIVLEGVIPPSVREPEGPFGEYTGYYTALKESYCPIVNYKAITCKKDPIFQTIYLGRHHVEGVFLRAAPHAADLFRAVQAVVPEVKDVYLTPGGCGRFHAVISIKKRVEGEGKLALGAVLSSRLAVKYAVVVDEDIDVHDLRDVEWAVATRSQFDTDSVYLGDAPGILDPSMISKRGKNLTAKFGLDATKPIDSDFPAICDVPKNLMEKVENCWDEYIG